MKRICFSCAAVVALGMSLVLTGCGGNKIESATDSDVAALKAAAAAPQPLQPGEKIQISVYGEPTLSGNFTIDPSGFVSLPVVGTLKVAGMTPRVLQDKLVAQIKANFIKDPEVTIEVAEFTPFYILGEIQRPGAYPYIGGLNVLNALAIAGGPTFRADQSTILIEHIGQTTMHSYSMDSPIPILPGDIIQVPRRYF